MNKFIIAVAALAAASSAAFAERSDDLRNSDTYFGKYSQSAQVSDSASDSEALAIGSDEWVPGYFGVSKDPLEVRRWEEKNNN